jgi:hypothetical protein
MNPYVVARNKYRYDFHLQMIGRYCSSDGDVSRILPRFRVSHCAGGEDADAFRPERWLRNEKLETEEEFEKRLRLMNNRYDFHLQMIGRYCSSDGDVSRILPRFRVSHCAANPNGLNIPAGCVVGMNPYVVARNKSVWGEDADAFRPDLKETQVFTDTDTTSTSK